MSARRFKILTGVSFADDGIHLAVISEHLKACLVDSVNLSEDEALALVENLTKMIRLRHIRMARST